MSTITLRNIKGSALTFTEMDNNFSNINTDKLENVVEDTTPQLGGDLDVNGNKITSASNGDIDIEPNGTGNVLLGNFTFDADQTVGAGQDNYVLTYDNGTGTISLEAAASGGISNVVEDTTPQLGGDLDVNGNSIVSSTNGNITIAPNGSGDIQLTPNTGNVDIDYATWPSADGSANQYLQTDGLGTLTWATVTPGISDVVEDTTPQLGGDLDVNGNDIVSVSNGNINVTPNGTGKTNLSNITYSEAVYTGLGTSGTLTPDPANGPVQTVSLTGNITINALGGTPAAGDSVTVIIDTNGTGRTLTSTMLFAGGSKTLSTTDTTDILTIFYDGTTYYASLATNFS